MPAFTLNHATEVNPGGSSQASSGYKYWARVNPNQKIASTADRNIPKSLKLGVTWRHAFFGNYNTMVSAFYTGHTGLPYTWIFSGDVNGDNVSYEDPVYIPTVNDPNVSYGSAMPPAVIQQFQDYIRTATLPEHASRPDRRPQRAALPWVNTMNVSFQQEVPGIFKGNKGIIRLDIYNFLNLVNKKWGDVRYVAATTRARWLATAASTRRVSTCTRCPPTATATSSRSSCRRTTPAATRPAWFRAGRRC